jgi:hypothetical protein
MKTVEIRYQDMVDDMWFEMRRKAHKISYYMQDRPGKALPGTEFCVVRGLS